MMPYQEKDYKVNVPCGKSGIWEVSRFTVTHEDAELMRLRSIMSFSSRGRYVPEGEYTKLTRNGYIIMSDTPDEIRDHLYMIHEAKGEILINGLGLGMVLNACLKNPEVSHATVIELSEDVIKLVGLHYKQIYGDRLTIIQANALQYKPTKGVRYGAVWHDIWDEINADNIPDMIKLHRKYGRICDWQGSWCRYLCERGRA